MVVVLATDGSCSDGLANVIYYHISMQTAGQLQNGMIIYYGVSPFIVDANKRNTYQEALFCKFDAPSKSNVACSNHVARILKFKMRI